VVNGMTSIHNQRRIVNNSENVLLLVARNSAQKERLIIVILCFLFSSDEHVQTDFITADWELLTSMSLG